MHVCLCICICKCHEEVMVLVNAVALAITEFSKLHENSLGVSLSLASQLMQDNAAYFLLIYPTKSAIQN